LKQPLEWLDNIQRAKKPERLPLVFTPDEVRSILLQLEVLNGSSPLYSMAPDFGYSKA
jgi:hypothetical protein